MKLDSAIVDYILNAVKAAHSIGIESVLIDSDSVRGMDENKTVVLLHTQVPEFPFNAISITRTGFFLSRFDLVKSQKDYTVEMTLDDNNNVQLLTFKAKRTKIEYRCGDPERSSACPRQLKETALFEVEMEGDIINLLQKGQAAMSAERVALIGKPTEKTVTFQMNDVGGDVFSHVFAESITKLNSSEDNFVHTYLIKLLITLFKQSTEGKFIIGKLGTLNVLVNGLNVYVLPRK